MKRTVACVLLGASILAGCAGPNRGLADLERVANATLDIAEGSLPRIADALGATITQVTGDTQREGGIEGNAPEVVFRVEGAMAGPEPTQDQMVQALADVGLVDAKPFVPGLGTTDAIQVEAESADGTVLVSLGYLDSGYPDRVFSVVFQSTEPMRMSDEDVDTFDRTFARHFDQSLVPVSPEMADLTRLANETLDLAELTLPALAGSLGVTITKAQGFAEGGGGEWRAPTDVYFVVACTMDGPRPTQDEVVQALIDAGYTQVVPRGVVQPSSDPYAMAISTDGTTTIAIYDSAPDVANPLLFFDIRNVNALRVANATVEGFRSTFTREFDQSLVHAAPN